VPAMENIADVPDHYFERGISLNVVRHHFQRGQSIIRIAAGFFTVCGYSLVRKAASGKKLFLLVGMEEPGKEAARRAMVSDILLDLRIGRDVDRRVAVRDLVERMRGGGLRILDARALVHHAKVYLVDETVALVASANVTGRGLQGAIEAGAVVRDADAVQHYVSRFDALFHAPECVDITQELLAAFAGWLEFVHPWNVYLRTLLALKSLEETRLQRPGYKNLFLISAT